MIAITCSDCGNRIRLERSQLKEGESNYLCSQCNNIIKLNYSSDKDERSSSDKETILIAEDAQSVCSMTKDILSQAGYEVITANDGQRALEIMLSETPDLLLLDLQMPKMSGFDVIEEVRKNEKCSNVPVLAMSGVYRDPSNIRMLRELGANGFINKDHLKETLLERVNHCLH